MSQVINAHAPYKVRPVPQSYDAAFLKVELGNIQRGTPSHTSRIITEDIRVDGTTKYYWVDCTAGNITLYLSPPDQVQDMEIVVKKTDASGNTVTLLGVVDGVTNPVLMSQYEGMTLVSSGAAWYLTAVV